MRSGWGIRQILTLILLVANLTNTKSCKKNLKNDSETLKHGYSAESALGELYTEYQYDRV